MAKDLAEECAEKWATKYIDGKAGAFSAQEAFEGAVREALEKAHAEVAGLVSCQDDCHCFDGDCERVKGVLETIRALGAK